MKKDLRNRTEKFSRSSQINSAEVLSASTRLPLPFRKSRQPSKNSTNPTSFKVDLSSALREDGYLPNTAINTLALQCQQTCKRNCFRSMQYVVYSMNINSS